jgi:hypothetical protein
MNIEDYEGGVYTWEHLCDLYGKHPTFSPYASQYRAISVVSENYVVVFPKWQYTEIALHNCQILFSLPDVLDESGHMKRDVLYYLYEPNPYYNGKKIVDILTTGVMSNLDYYKLKACYFNWLKDGYQGW